jgi:signal transduction histidine kinase/DNA-binding response OmpR family regulator
LSGGLDLLDRSSGKFSHNQYKEGQPSPLQSNYIAALIEDRSGNLWVGTAIGLTMFEKKSTQALQYHHYNNSNGLSNNNVITLLEDSKGRIWVGTREGLNVFDHKKNSFRSFSLKDGLPDNTVLTILEDHKHNLWITTPNGLCNLVLNNEAKVEDLSFTVINYDETNNLQDREFNDNAALRTRSGELIFGGPSGFNIIDPARIQRPQGDPKIVFTNLQILNNNIEVGEEVNNRIILNEALPEIEKIKLKHKENIFSIEFAALDFSHSSRSKYAYKLEGFNDEWLYTDGLQRKATYTNLDPGSYVLKVKVLNSNGEWSKEKVLHIRITPPFWRTPLAYLIYTAFVAGILLLARRITVDRAHMRFEVKQQRKEAERMQALDTMKTKFFTNVSHEFRTPLSLIISPLDKIIKNINDPEQKKQLHLVHRNAKRLLNLVNQLLDFRKMEVQEFKLHPVVGDIVKFIKDISFSFSDISEKKNIEYIFESNVSTLEIYFDKDKLEKILFNLLSNAYKYTPDNGKVSVRLEYRPEEEKEGSFAIHVCDTGIGIPKDKQERIFERFFQHDVPESMVNQGSGIGLSITREFVKLHNGTITVNSEPDKGSCFTVVLPARKISDAINQSAVSEKIMPSEVVEETENESGNNKKKTILLVEDNEDFRFYLKDNLKTLYNVEEAANGKEGLEKVRKLNPELVVSDIMMPLMNGIELARKIKSDTITAHIPVILLTAVGSEEVQMEGYDIGINDYITKPFTFEILASRIKNLLAQQKLLKKNFQKQLEVNPSEITITPLDELFMKQALAAVEKNIGNPDYSVEDLSRDMHMSRVALYKKILALTGKAPLEFIRTIRLKRGAQLLEKSGMTIAEIAYEVGFNNPKNFSKYFKEEFKVLPSQYQTQKN